MKLGKTRNKVSTEFNMSSMTDIVFLLLIFFMLTSTMVTTNALDLVLPKAKGKTRSRWTLEGMKECPRDLGDERELHEVGDMYAIGFF